MAKTKISEYDSTAANNTDIDSINIAEGMAPSNVNNALRQMMAHLKTEFFKTGTGNTSLGDTALDSLDGTSPGGNNTAIGFGALTANTTASNNTAVGKDAGLAISTGANNVAVGFEALRTEDGNGNNVAIGYQALKVQNAGVDANNIAVGYQAGVATTTGSNNVLIGALAGDAITDGNTNVAIGNEALSTNVQGDRNVAVGHKALETLNPSGDADTLNTAVGFKAGNALTTGVNSTFLGADAGTNVTTGNKNTMVGDGAGKHISTGASNTIIGRYSGNASNGVANLDIREKSGNIILSDGDGNPYGYFHGGSTSPLWDFYNGGTNNQWTMRLNNATSDSAPFGMQIIFRNRAPDNNSTQFLACRDSSTNRCLITNQGDLQNHDNSYGAISDVKVKDQIEDASSQWQDVKDLTVRKYKMKSDIEEKGDSDDLWRLGVIAQEVETAGMSGLVYETPDLDEDMNDLGTTTKAVKYSILYMKAVKALQEAMARIETLETKVAALEG